MTVVEQETIPTPGGMLAVRGWPGSGRPLVCLHGFTLTGEMFTGLASAVERPLLAPDLPGHGATRVAPVDLETTVTALGTLLERCARPVDLLGYSQGGRVAIHVATRHPAAIATLVMVSAGPGLPPETRTRRRGEDRALADHIETIGIDRFVTEWMERPVVRTGPGPVSHGAMRRSNTATGLAAALRGLGQGALPAADPAALAMHSVWVAGERDERYVAVARRAAAAAGTRARVIPGAGHDVVTDAPGPLAEVIGGLPDRSHRRSG